MTAIAQVAEAAGTSGISACNLRKAVQVALRKSAPLSGYFKALRQFLGLPRPPKLTLDMISAVVETMCLEGLLLYGVDLNDRTLKSLKPSPKLQLKRTLSFAECKVRAPSTLQGSGSFPASSGPASFTSSSSSSSSSSSRSAPSRLHYAIATPLSEWLIDLQQRGGKNVVVACSHDLLMQLVPLQGTRAPLSSFVAAANEQSRQDDKHEELMSDEPASSGDDADRDVSNAPRPDQLASVHLDDGDDDFRDADRDSDGNGDSDDDDDDDEDEDDDGDGDGDVDSDGDGDGEGDGDDGDGVEDDRARADAEGTDTQAEDSSVGRGVDEDRPPPEAKANPALTAFAFCALDYRTLLSRAWQEDDPMPGG